MDGYFRPVERDHHDPYACVPCYCDPVGSTGMCVKDAAHASEGQEPGDCVCKEGYCGARCDECSPGYQGYPNCEPCACSRAGSTNEDVCGDTCTCKVNDRISLVVSCLYTN